MKPTRSGAPSTASGGSPTSPVAVDDDRQTARRAAATFLGGVYSQDFDPIVDRVTASGAPDDVVQRLQELLDAGAEELIILPCGDDPTAVAERVLTEIVPRLRTTVEPTRKRRRTCNMRI